MLFRMQLRRVFGRPRVTPTLVFIIIILSLFLWEREAHVHADKTGKRRHRPARIIMPEPERQEKLLREKAERFQVEAKDLESAPEAGAIYGNTLKSLVDQDTRLPDQQSALKTAGDGVSFTAEEPSTFDPYPYRSAAWRSKHNDYVPCVGPTGTEIRDIRVFKGRPSGFPKPGFGSYDVLGIDQNLCFERETRLGQYGLTPVVDKDGRAMDWERVNWGELQSQCREKNKARFNPSGPPNAYAMSLDEASERIRGGPSDLKAESPGQSQRRHLSPLMKRGGQLAADGERLASNATSKTKEPRTALLLRSYTGKEYNDNDKQIIRSLVTELSLRTGGEYEVFLFLHVKDETDIWASEEDYRRVVETHVPREFWNMTVLWNTELVRLTYPKLTPKALLVHNGQFSPVQIFAQIHREFDFVWNWELDSRVIGHHYDVLSKLGEFARKQPRKGLWERNERYYIPSFHGDYDTDFRATVEGIHIGGDSVWGAPDVPVVRQPVGPEPPVADPDDDDYEWGVGEDADLITLAPIFNPVNSNWILRNQVWGYRSGDFAWGDLPRRATIITQARASRRLLDIMHAEDLRGNHVASEMAAQTAALLHGLKAVYAPIPVFFDRPWDGAQLARWFNGGPKGESGSFGSAMGWGQEARFQGTTWYFRAVPPQRMYNNWMGYEDTGVGGPEWEAANGRTCLPAMLLHPVKEVRPTEVGYSSNSKLPYR